MAAESGTGHDTAQVSRGDATHLLRSVLAWGGVKEIVGADVYDRAWIALEALDSYASAPADLPVAAPDPAESGTGHDTAQKGACFCGAFTHVSLVSDGDQGECGTEFTVIKDDPECPTEWWPCPKCGNECEVEWSSVPADLHVAAPDPAQTIRHAMDVWRGGGTMREAAEAALESLLAALRVAEERNERALKFLPDPASVPQWGVPDFRRAIGEARAVLAVEEEEK